MEIVRQGRDTMLVAGVPKKRGTPTHFEHDDETAFTQFDNKTGKVIELHTPRNTVIRIHELLHARHTVDRRYKKAYRDVEDIVGQITEDVRIHALFWPWHHDTTPHSIREAMQAYLVQELKRSDDQIVDDPTRRGSWGDFATRLRAAAVLGGDRLNFDYWLERVNFASEEQKQLASAVIQLVRNGQEDKAAMKMATVFNKAIVRKPPPGAIVAEGGAGTGYATDFGMPIITVDSPDSQPTMEIIELPKTEHCKGAGVGTRRATMGSRMYRPALRRPLLPQRLFLRRTPVEPGGTILIDASGSMGNFDEIAEWAEEAPFGTIAYYAGDEGHGWLWIYARDGRRAVQPEKPEKRGNTVDGPALTWLMSQPAPRIFVTDRGFCGSHDSNDQKARLKELERTNQVKVVNYRTDKEDE